MWKEERERKEYRVDGLICGRNPRRVDGYVKTLLEEKGILSQGFIYRK